MKFVVSLNAHQPNMWAYQEGFIEGDLKIYLHERLYFHDPYINVAEFGNQLGKWLNKVQQGLLEQMNYTSIDHDEVIMSFTYERADTWRIHSIWQEFESDKLISTENLVEGVKNYLVDLNHELHKIKYCIKMDKYLR
ncbi:hypothetical protein [Bacillus sp. PS06]|uniref:DUF7878 domain-containing protein n=1 Tax=Bacillus sp. PS06 TaxID=2764176 RepID=UPI001784F950|nr:hypothetical protein [Bacillus sp. PS06]MBD8068821.1 hypothetical protein [Bacillus sp. PS06]